MNFAGAMKAMDGVVNKAVELAGEYKGLLKNEGGLGRASRKAMNEVSDKNVKNMTKTAREVASRAPKGREQKVFDATMGAQNIKSRNIANKYGREAENSPMENWKRNYEATKAARTAHGMESEKNIAWKKDQEKWKNFDYQAAKKKRMAAQTMSHDNLTQGAFNKAMTKTNAEVGARTVKHATQDYFLDPLKAFQNSTGAAKTQAGKQFAARAGTAALGVGAVGMATQEL